MGIENLSTALSMLAHAVQDNRDGSATFARVAWTPDGIVTWAGKLTPQGCAKPAQDIDRSDFTETRSETFLRWEQVLPYFERHGPDYVDVVREALGQVFASQPFGMHR